MKEEIEESDLEYEEKNELLNVNDIFQKKEEILRKDFKDVFEKYSNFIDYIINYLRIKLKEYIEANLNKIKKEMLKFKKIIEQKIELSKKF